MEYAVSNDIDINIYISYLSIVLDIMTDEDSVIKYIKVFRIFHFEGWKFFYPFSQMK